MLNLKKNLQKIVGVFIFSMIFYTTFSDREIPHSIIKNNPNKEVTEINTLERRKNKAELNISVTKVNSENIEIQVDKSRKKMFVTLEDVTVGDQVFIKEKIEAIPTPETGVGRKAINRQKRSTTNIDSNLKYDIKVVRNTGGKKRLEIDYTTLPKEVYLGVTDSKYDVKKVYKGVYKDYNVPKNNRVSIKLWLFAEDFDKHTNLVIDPSNNGSGNFKIRSQSSYSSPENAVEKSGTHSVFEMSGSLIDFDFEDSDKVTIENEKNITVQKNNQGSFYDDKNKYSEFSMGGYKAKARIWSEYKGIELSLEKNNGEDGYSSFKLVHKDSNNNLIQEINFEIYRNNNEFKKYFNFGDNGREIQYSRNLLNKYINIPLINEIQNLFIDELNINVLKNFSTEKRYGETGVTELLPFEKELKYRTRGLNVSNNEITKASITDVEIYIPEFWYSNLNNTAQFFTAEGIELAYAKNKRVVPVRIRLGIYRSWRESTEILSGTIKGLPILNSPLNKNNINGVSTIEFSKETQEFKFVQQGSNMEILGNGVVISKIGKLNESITIPEVDKIEYGVKHLYTETTGSGYSHWALSIKKMELSNTDRNSNIKGLDIQGSNRIVSKENRIKIPKFNSLNLINEFNTSVDKNIVRIEDVSDSLANNGRKKSIDLGSVYFYEFNTEILKQNTDQNPKVILSSSVILEAQTNNIQNKKIKVALSFDRSLNEKKEISLDISKDKGGGNGGSIYLNIEEDEYNKFLKNGGNVTYKLISSEDIAKVGFIANKSPFGSQSNRSFWNKLIESVTIKTRAVSPSISKIEFIDKKPLLKNHFFKVINNSISYESAPSNYNYNSTLNLSGNVEPYKTQGKHNVEIIDSDGKIIKTIIGSSGSGSLWKSIEIGGKNKVNIRYEKDKQETYIALDEWNFKEANGNIIIKHFHGNSENVGQYYSISFEIPSFDPLTYYNKNYTSDTIVPGANLKVTRETGKNEIILGKIATHDYDVEITKHANGTLKDSEGLRIEGNQIVTFKEKDTSNIYSKKGKIKFKDINNGIDIGENKIVGENKKAIVILEIPDDLPKNKEWVIESNDTNMLLKIGRNKFFKDLINSIEISKSENGVGSSKLKFTNEYTLKNEVIFNAQKRGEPEILASLKNPITGISLEDKTGSGLIKAENCDKFIIEDGSMNYTELVNTNGGTAKKEIDIGNGNKISLQFKDGLLHVSLDETSLGDIKSKKLKLILEDKANKRVMEHDLTIESPASFFRIEEKEDIDFGNVAAGSKNRKATGRIKVEASNEITKDKIAVLFSTKTPKLMQGTLELPANIDTFNIIKDAMTTLNKYDINLEGKLNTNDNTPTGPYKATVEVIISVKP